MDQTTHNLPAPPRADGMAGLKARRADNMDLMPHAPSVSLRRPLHTSRPHVVIVGGGFGGLYTARGLARTPVDVTVVDQHNYHVFRPMLYQVATGLLSADEIAAPIRSVLWKQKNTEVLMAEVIGVDTQHHLVQRQESDLPYDYLILATGAHYNYFGHDEWRTVAPGLHSVDDADLIRGKLLRAFEDAERLATYSQAEPDLLQELLTFILVGGGTAGVEMAGTIAEMARMALAHDFRRIDPRAARIVLFEAAPRILPGYPEQLAARAHQHLEHLGVQVRTNTKVEDVNASGVVVAGQRIGSRTVVWTAGVVASPAGQWLGVDTDRAGRVKVQPDLSMPGHPNIFAIGDTASVVAPTRNLFHLKRQRRVDVIMPLKTNMLATQEAMQLAEMADKWEAHPSRDDQSITLVRNVEHMWAECEVPLNACVIRFWNQRKKRHEYIVLVTTDLKLSASWIVRHYEERPEIEQDYQQMKSGGWQLKKLSSTRYSEIVFYVLTVVLSYSLYHLFANTQAGSRFADKTRQAIAFEQLRTQRTHIIVYAGGYFEIFETLSFVQMVLQLSPSVQARLQTWLAEHLNQTQKRE